MDRACTNVCASSTPIVAIHATSMSSEPARVRLRGSGRKSVTDGIVSWWGTRDGGRGTRDAVIRSRVMPLDKLNPALVKDVQALEKDGRAKAPERVITGYVPA